MRVWCGNLVVNRSADIKENTENDTIGSTSGMTVRGAKMIKEDNLHHTNKLYLRLHEVDSLLSENYKMGQKARNFHKIKKKNKDETNRKYLLGWGHIVTLVGGEKAQSWLGLWGLADWTHCLSGQAEHLQGHECLLMWHSGKELCFNRGTALW